MLRRSIFHNKILISSLKYVRNPVGATHRWKSYKMYLEPLVVKEVSGVPSADPLKLQWKTSLLGLETTSQGNSCCSISATPTTWGSSKPQYGESEKKENLCIILLGIHGLSEEILLFTLSLLCRWIYRQDFLWNALFSMNRAGGKNLDKQNIIGTANKQFPCKKG